jgi:phage FluMu protein Com
MNHGLGDDQFPCTRAVFEKAALRYSIVVVIAGVCAFGIFDLCLFLGAVWLHLRPQLLAWPMKLALAVVPAATAIAFLIVAVRRARRNSTLHCVYCDKSLANGDATQHVLVTGKCPYCTRRLLEGSLKTSGEAVQRVVKLKREVRRLLRFTVAACVLGHFAAFAVFLWVKATAPPDLPINWSGLLLLSLAAFSFLIGGAWLASRGDIRQAERYAEVMQDMEANGPT